MSRIVLTILLLAVAFPSFGSEDDVNRDGYVDILIPLFFPVKDGQPLIVEGAYGSRWAGEAWLHNETTFDLFVESIQRGFLLCEPSCRIAYPRGTTASLEGASFSREPNRGALWALRDDPAKTHLGLTFSARVLELSRRAQPNGVEVPVVYEHEFLSTATRLIGIPRKTDSRVSLRVYDPRRRVGSAVRVDLLSIQGTPIASTTLTPGANLTIDVAEPGYASINDLEVLFPQLAAYDRFDIVITPLTEATEFWAFAAVTDRDTQHVLFVTPDR